MKTLSLRLTVLGILPVLALFACVTSTCAEELYKDAWYYRELFEAAKDRAAEARELDDKKSEREAIDGQISALGQYLKQSPNDLEMLERYAVLLAENYRDVKMFELASATLRELVEKDPEHTEARKRLSVFLMLPAVHRYNDACEQLERILQISPNDSETLTMLGRCQIAMSKSEKAVANFERAIECSPKEVDAYFYLAIALRVRLNRPEEADGWMDKMIAANPDSALAHCNMCKYLLMLKKDSLDPKAALIHAERALELDPENIGTLSLAAQSSLASGNFESARRYAAQGLEMEKTALDIREQMYRMLADAECRSKNIPKGLEILQRAFEELKKPELLWLQADLQCDMGDVAGAERALKQLTAIQFSEGGLDYLRGRIYLRKSMWREAGEALDKAITAYAGNPEILKRLECWRGLCFGQLGNYDEQIAAFRRAITLDPSFAPAQQALDASLKLAERKKAAIPLNGQGSKESLTILAKAYLAENDWNKAREILGKLADDFPEDSQLMANFIRELLVHRELGEAEAKLSKLEEKWPNHVQTTSLRAELLLRHGKSDDAIDMMKDFIDAPDGFPADRGQRMRLMGLAMEDFAGRLKLADEPIAKERLLRTAELLLRQYADLHPSAAGELVGFLARQERFAEAADLLEKNWKSIEPLSLSMVCCKIAQDGRGPKEYVERMRAILREARKFFDDNPAFTLTLGNLYTGAGEYPEAEECFREVLRKRPNYTVAMNNLAALLTMRQKDLPEALELIDSAMKIAGRMPSMLDTRACVYIAQGEADKALADLSEALAGGKTPEMLFHQAQAYELAGKMQLAAKAMKESLAKGLNAKSLSAREIPIFERLKKMADELPPEKDGGPAPVDDYAALSYR